MTQLDDDQPRSVLRKIRGFDGSKKMVPKNLAVGGSGREPTPWLLGFLCLLVPMLPQNSVLPGPLKGNGSPARMLAVLLFGLVVLGFFTGQRKISDRRINPGAIIILLYLALWLCLYGTGLLETDRSPGWTSIEANRTRGLITLIAYVGIALYALRYAKTFRQRTTLLGCLTIGLTIANIIGLLQATTGIDLRSIFAPPGFVTNVDDATNLKRMGLARVMGTSQHPIEFAVLSAVTIPLTVYFARHAVTRNGRALALTACGIALLAMPAAVSRSGLVSLSVALIVYMLAFKVRHILTALTAGVTAILLYTAIFPSTAAALWSTVTGSAEDESIRARTEDYAVVGDIFRAHPAFGLGLGGQPTLFDNQWLQVIAQGGLVGLSAMLLLTGGTAFGISAALRSASTCPEREQAYLLGAVAAGILASSTTFDSFWYQQVTFVLMIVFGMLWAPFNITIPPFDRDGFF